MNSLEGSAVKYSVIFGPGNGSPSATKVVVGDLVVIRFSKY